MPEPTEQQVAHAKEVLEKHAKAYLKGHGFTDQQADALVDYLVLRPDAGVPPGPPGGGP